MKNKTHYIIPVNNDRTNFDRTYITQSFKTLKTFTNKIKNKLFYKLVKAFTDCRIILLIFGYNCVKKR